MPSAANDTSLKGKCILVVEDEFLISLDIRHILESAGATSIVTAGGGADALAALTRTAVDAAVLDLRLDKDSSIPIAEQLLAKRVPFVFLTGAPSEASEARQFSGVPIVGKPFDGATLLAALSRALPR